MNSPASSRRTSPVGEAAFRFIFISLLLDLIATGIVIPVLPRLILSFTGGNFPRAAEAFGLLMSLWALMQLMCSPAIGALSDRCGRKPMILSSNLAQATDHLIMALAPALPFLFLGKLISGIGSATVPLAYAYVADILPIEHRAGFYAKLNVAFGLMFLVGPVLGGSLAEVDARLPFFVAAGLGLANFLYGVVALPESLTLELRTPFTFRVANPAASLKFLRRTGHLARLATLSFLLQAAQQALVACSVLYMTYRYRWDGSQVGTALACVGAAYVVVQAGVMRPLTRRWPEKTITITGLAMGFAGFLIYGSASTGTVYLLGIPVMELWGLAQPAVYALMTKEVAGNEQGRLQGANASLLGLASLTGPWIFARLFSAGVDPELGLNLPGLPFYVAALLMLGGLAIAARLCGPWRHF